MLKKLLFCLLCVTCVVVAGAGQSRLSPPFDAGQLAAIAKTGANLRFNVSDYDAGQVVAIVSESAKAGGKVELYGCQKFDPGQIAAIGQAGKQSVTVDLLNR